MYGFYRAMHFSAKRGIAIACRLSVRLSVCPSVTLVDCDHIGWNSSEIISPYLVSLGCSLSADPNVRGLLHSKGNTLAQCDPTPVDLSEQESPADAEKPARRESTPKIAPIRRENKLQTT